MGSTIRRFFLALCAFTFPGAAFAAAPPDVPTKLVAKGDDLARATALATAVQNRSLNIRQRIDAGNARAWLHLAATHDDPKVVAAALMGMERTWSRTAKGKSKRAKVDEDYRKVVLARLKDADGAVRAGALRATRLLLGEKPDAEVLARIIEMIAKDSPAGREAAMAAAFNIQDFQLAQKRAGDVKDRVVAAIAPALEASEPWLVAAALHHLARTAFPEMPQRDGLMAKARALLAHADPGVRGQAMLLAARIAKKAEHEELGSELAKGLTDPHPHVRATAAEATGTVQYQPAVPAMVKLLDDGEKNAYVLTGYTALDGEKGKLPLGVVGNRVDESALEGLALMTKGLPKRFEYGGLSGKDSAKKRTDAIAKAKAFFGGGKDAEKAAAAPEAAAEAGPDAKTEPKTMAKPAESKTPPASKRRIKAKPKAE